MFLYEIIYTNLLVIDTHRFHIIFEMDWLSTFHTVIDCRKRSIIFRTSYYSKFEFIGSNNSIETIEYKAVLRKEY